MNSKMMSFVCAWAVGCFVASAAALCPDSNCACAGKKAAAASAGEATTTAGHPCDPANCACKKAMTAGQKPGGCNKPCGAKAGGTETAASDSGDTARPVSQKVEAVLASLPSMMYQVGSETTGCPQSAAAMAEKTGQPVKYLVGEEVVADKTEATAKLTTLLEKEAAALRAMQFSAGGVSTHHPLEAKSIAEKNNTTVVYRVGGLDFAEQAKAEKAIQLVGEAVAGVKMSYKVDGQSFCCSQMAGAKAKESGKPITYVVGTDETVDEKTAQLLFAQAKIRAIVETAAAALAS